MKAPLHVQLPSHHCKAKRANQMIFFQRSCRCLCSVFISPLMMLRLSAYTAAYTRLPITRTVLYVSKSHLQLNTTTRARYPLHFYYSTVQPEYRLAPLTRCTRPLKGMIPWYQPEGCEPPAPFRPAESVTIKRGTKCSATRNKNTPY